MHRWNPPSFDEPSGLQAWGGAQANLSAAVSAVPDSTQSSAAEAQPSAETVSMPTVQAMQNLQAKAYQEGFQQGLEEGRLQGHREGKEVGQQAGFDQGKAEGFQTGFQQGFESGTQQAEAMVKQLHAMVNDLAALPQSLAPVLNEWVYETALRLAGQTQWDRSAFVQAVQEALMRLPRPGEHVYIRVPPAELASWQQLLQSPEMPFQALIQSDADVASGHAYLEAFGTHLDVGFEARKALVRSALGLLPVQQPTDTSV